MFKQQCFTLHRWHEPFTCFILHDHMRWSTLIRGDWKWHRESWNLKRHWTFKEGICFKCFATAGFGPNVWLVPNMYENCCIELRCLMAGKLKFEWSGVRMLLSCKVLWQLRANPPDEHKSVFHQGFESWPWMTKQFWTTNAVRFSLVYAVEEKLCEPIGVHYWLESSDDIILCYAHASPGNCSLV